MPLSQRPTLTQYLIEQRRRFPGATGGFNALILDIALACKAIARAVAAGALGDTACGHEHAPRPDGAAALRDIGRDAFVRMNEWGGHCAGILSADRDAPTQIPSVHPRGPYLLLFDPLDGAGNLDVNASAGSVFSVLRAPPDVEARGRDVVEDDFLQPGAQQLAAGYALYGPTTLLVLTVGNGVAGFTLDPSLGEFFLTHPGMRVPEQTSEFAIDAANSRFWEPPVRRYVDECLAGREGPRGKDFEMRWIASMVGEAHRILLRGGVFLCPRDSKDPARSGRLRLLTAANPLGFVIEQAGGRASTGRQPVLDVAPGALDQRLGLVFGSRPEVERIERYHADPARALESPLFCKRGLFRD